MPKKRLASDMVRMHGLLVRMCNEVDRPEAFAHSIDLSPVPICDVKNLGVLQRSQISEQKRIQKHRPKTVSLKHAEMFFKYVMRTTEDNDTPAIVSRRDALFRRAHIEISYASSRSKTSKKVEIPHQYPADRLDKPAYLFPFDGDELCEIAPENYQQTLTILRKQADEHVDSWFPS